MSLNQALAFLKKTLNFQGTVDLSLNNPTVDATGSATAGEKDEILQEVSKLGRNWENLHEVAPY